MKLQAEEEKALSHAAELLRYAAESPKTVPDTLVLPISDAWKAQQDGTWTPELATKFWMAYSSLCNLLKPVTVDTIATTKTDIPNKTANFYRVVSADTITNRHRIGIFCDGNYKYEQ